MKLHFKPYQIELIEPFTISRGTFSKKDILLVELHHEGKIGLGEACEHAYYDTYVPDMLQRLQALQEKIEAYTFMKPEDFWIYLNEEVKDHRFLQCALDVAAHDLHGKIIGKPLYQLWNLALNDLPTSNYTIPLNSIEKTIAKVKTLSYPILKIKLGGHQDMEVLRAIRAHTDAVLRIDANAAWTAEQTMAYMPTLVEAGVEFIEQPLRYDDWEGMKWLQQRSELPIIADESCRVYEDVEECAPYFDGINIKLMKCGGLTPALKMIEKARSLDLKVMAGCMTETTIGISALAQLLPLLDEIDMDGATLLKNDPAEGIRLGPDGRAIFNDMNGTGAYIRAAY